MEKEAEKRGFAHLFGLSRIIGSFRKGGQEDVTGKGTADWLRSEGGAWGRPPGHLGSGPPGRHPRAEPGGHTLGVTGKGGWKEKREPRGHLADWLLL